MAVDRIMRTLRKKFPVLFLIGFFCAWSLSVWWYGFYAIQQSYIDQQQAKATMVGAMIAEFILSPRLLSPGLSECWNDVHPDRCEDHFIIKKFANRILSVAGYDRDVLDIKVISGDKTYWFWSLAEEDTQTPSAEVVVDIIRNRRPWGKIVMRVDMSSLLLARRASVSNILSMSFGLSALVLLFFPRRRWVK